MDSLILAIGIVLCGCAIDNGLTNIAKTIDNGLTNIAKAIMDRK